MPKKTSDAFEWLIEHGPATRDEAPTDKLYTITLREKGVRRVFIRASPSSVAALGNVRAVYYHPDHHSDEAVIRAVFEANPVLLDASFAEIHSLFDREWNDTVTAVLKDEYGIYHHAEDLDNDD